jgi:16S rRNA (cytidine1402-2'-O)-methyltransferase
LSAKTEKHGEDRRKEGQLYVVATPIGNLQDVTLRALAVLGAVELVAAEDTRTASVLLDHHGIRARLVSLHEHNERRAAEGVIDALREGSDVALVSDAGTPAVSDPGAHLVARARAEGFRVTPVPGPNAAIAALSAAGLPQTGFLFLGFLPAKRAARRKAIEALATEPWPLVLYEAPHRIAKTLEDLLERFGPQREVAIARELTKKFEEVARLPLGEARAWLDADSHRTQGEFVLVIGPGEEKRIGAPVDPDVVLEALLEALSPSDAARIAARITGLPKNVLYRKALARAK